MRAFISILFLMGVHVSMAQITLVGSISDQSSKKPIEAKIVGINNGKKQPLGKSENNGNFKINIDTEINAILIEANDYRPLYLPLHFNNTLNTSAFPADFTLIPIGKQASNKPFDQSEQSQFQLDDKSTDNKAKSIRTFRIIDGFTNKMVNAQLCLFYTQTSSKKCFTLSESNSNATVSFTNKDIIAIEVIAAGYQKYNGNLIIDNLDSQKQAFDIGLNKIPTFLSITTSKLNENQKLVIKSENGTSVYLKSEDNQHWFGSALPQKKYNIDVVNTKTNAINFNTNLSLSDGLQFVSIELKEQTKLAKVEEIKTETQALEPVSLLPQEQRIIYFDQSDCIIKPDLKPRLDAVVQWMKQYSDIRVRIVGHTDDVGDPKLNEILSELRAKAVYNYLYNKGIPENRLLYAGYGGKYPVKPNDIEANKSMNRRVEIGYIMTNK